MYHSVEVFSHHGYLPISVPIQIFCNKPHSKSLENEDEMGREAPLSLSSTQLSTRFAHT